MTHYQEGQSDVSVPSCDDPPQQVPDHIVVFILARAVVCVEVHISLTCIVKYSMQSCSQKFCYCRTQPVVLQEVVQLADHRVGALPTVTCLITKEIDLAWEGLAVNTKDCTLSWSEKEHWARL